MSAEAARPPILELQITGRGVCTTEGLLKCRCSRPRIVLSKRDANETLGGCSVVLVYPYPHADEMRVGKVGDGQAYLGRAIPFAIPTSVAQDDRLCSGHCWICGCVDWGLGSELSMHRLQVTPLASDGLAEATSCLLQVSLAQSNSSSSFIGSAGLVQGHLIHEALTATLRQMVVTASMRFVCMGLFNILVVSCSPENEGVNYFRVVDRTSVQLVPVSHFSPSWRSSQISELRSVIESAVCGQGQALEAICNLLEDKIAGRAQNIGMILYGESGCGKSTTCCAIKTHFGPSCKVVQCLTLAYSNRGHTERAIRDTFLDCMRGSMLVLILENLDCCCAQDLTAKSILDLTCTDAFAWGIDELRFTNCVVIATVGDILQVNGKLSRPGRLGVHIEYRLPDRDVRSLFLHTVKCATPLSCGDTPGWKESSDIAAWRTPDNCLSCSTEQKATIESIAEKTQGFSFADLQCVCEDVSSYEHANQRLSNLALRRSGIHVEALASIATLDDIPPIYGCEKEMQILRDMIVLPLERQHRPLHEALRVRPAPGVLITGASGTGKTLLVKAFAKEVKEKFKFIQVSGADLIQKVVGESEKLLSNMFKSARKVAPCILLLENLDAIAQSKGAQRTQSSRTSHHAFDRVLSTLLVEMDGVSSKSLDAYSPVVVFVTTEHASWIDSSLLRPGRLELHLHLTAPDMPTRTKIISSCLAEMPIDASLTDRQALVESLASCYNGLSAASLQSICTETALRVIRENPESQFLTVSDFHIATGEGRKSIQDP